MKKQQQLPLLTLQGKKIPKAALKKFYASKDDDLSDEDDELSKQFNTEAGAVLRKARIKQKKTLEELSEETKIPVFVLEDYEGGHPSLSFVVQLPLVYFLKLDAKKFLTSLPTSRKITKDVKRRKKELRLK